MSELNFKQKMYWLCALGAISALLVGSVGFFAQKKESDAIDRSVTISEALRHHLEGDMMHDALRGDVLAAMLAATQGRMQERDSVLADFNDHADWFRKTISANRELPLSADISAALETVVPELDAYIREADSIINLAFNDLNAAQQQQARFMESFEKLEGRMEEVSDLISAGMDESKSRLNADLVFYESFTVVILLLAATVIVMVGTRIIKSILQQLGGDPAYAMQVVQKVAAGDLNVVIQQEPNSNNSLLHAIEDMRQKLKHNFDEMTRIGAETRRQAEESLRVRQALDVCDTAALIADADSNVIYVNRAGERLFQATETSFVNAGIALSARKLVGWNIQPVVRLLNIRLQDLRETKKQRQVVADRTFDIVITPVLGADRAIVGYVLEWQDLTQQLAQQEREQQAAQDNARVKQALDNVTANTMIADSDGNIVYMNQAVMGMLKTAENDIRKALPHFDTQRLQGANFDSFHKNPAHQRSLLDNLTGTYRSQINVGGRTFSLVANPILNENKQRIGSVVEWADRTQEVAIENELNSMLDAANAGDLTRRISLTDKQGFFLNLSKGLNQLLGVADDVISNAIRVMDALAHGRLNEKIDRDYRGMFDKLKQDTNTTVDILVNVVEKITESANSVAAGAQEIAQGNQDLSQRTEEQASSLEETASSMEEMNSAVKQSSENAASANHLAAEAFDRAGKGGEVVNRAVDAMSAISTSSKKIADIIAVIDEIAFQTNLLALNAAVEAARAGEQGRGFAVVAGEVRNLAQRSASAAKEIKDLIRDSVNKVEDGTRLVNESGTTFGELVTAVRNVSAIVQDMANAANEQASGISQVNMAVAQMDQMTQQNAALVEEASAAGETLAEQAHHLLELIAFFKMEGAGAPRSAARNKTAP